MEHVIHERSHHEHVGVIAEPILADKFTADLPVTRVWVGLVADPKATSALLRALHTAFPLPALAHCKRVSRVQPSASAAQTESGGCNGDGNIEAAGCDQRGEQQQATAKKSSRRNKVHAHPTQLLVILFEAGEATDAGSAIALLKTQGLHEAVRDPVLVDVPAAKPITREQYTVAAALWPVLFHEDKRVARALCGELFTSEELRVRAWPRFGVVVV